MSISSNSRFATQLATLVLLIAVSAGAREKDSAYGVGIVVNVPLPAAEVTQVVEDIAQNGIIRGSKEYNKDEYIEGAELVSSTKLFPASNEGGKVFYKERKKVLGPRNFKDSNDMGTVAVRYVVQQQSEKNTIVRINALFVEDFRRTAHPSNGSVENAEYKDIREHLDAIELAKHQAVEMEKMQASSKSSQPAAEVKAQNLPTTENNAAVVETTESQPIALATVNEGAPGPASDSPSDSLEQHVKDLRHQLEWLVKAPGAPLKSSPFQSAHTLQALAPGSEVLLLITTPYWYGVETRDGQRGWISRDQLEQTP